MKSTLREDVIARLDPGTIMGLVGAMGIQCKRVGSEYVCLCPAHDDKNPSCTINPKKEKVGIFKCFSCGFGGDIFAMTMQVQGIEFRPALEWVAGQLGLGPKRDASKNAAPKAVVEHKETPLMTPDEIFDEMTRLEKSRLPDGLATERLGVRPDAVEALGMFFCKEKGRELLVAPMRKPDGQLCSLRFRCSETKRRWSLDRKDHKGEQIASTQSGLMAHISLFESGPGTFQETITIEGETDALAGTSMAIDECGHDPRDWSGMFIALPGVNSCHEMLVPEIVGKRAWIFFDRDDAGERAVFDHRWRDKDGNVDLKREMKLGLLHKHANAGITAVAAFPPRGPDGSKVDLRDLYRKGWTWHDLENHFIQTGTRDVLGLKEVRR